MSESQPRVFGFHLNQETLIREGVRRNFGNDNTEWARLLLAERTANILFAIPAGRVLKIRAEIYLIKRKHRNPGPDGDLGWFVALASTDPKNPYEKPDDEMIAAFMGIVGLKRQPQWAIMA